MRKIQVGRLLPALLEVNQSFVYVLRTELNLCWAISMDQQHKVWPPKSSVQEGRSEIHRLGNSSPNRGAREAIGLYCNVTSWDDQVNLFQTAFDTFGSVDIVVRCVFNTLRKYKDKLVAGCECRSERNRQLFRPKSQERKARETGDGYCRCKPVGIDIQ